MTSLNNGEPRSSGVRPNLATKQKPLVRPLKTVRCVGAEHDFMSPNWEGLGSDSVHFSYATRFETRRTAEPPAES